MFCQKCGAELNNDSNFCPSCGQPARGQASDGQTKCDCRGANSFEPQHEEKTSSTQKKHKKSSLGRKVATILLAVVAFFFLLVF